jgi:hypothetical protein
MRADRIDLALTQHEVGLHAKIEQHAARQQEHQRTSLIEA